MKIYRIKWKSYNETVPSEIVKAEDFTDVQWKEYGVRAVNDETGEEFIIPYYSIYETEILEIKE